jgi:uncharacterized tellurite resistance protein B-like protein
MTPNDMNILKSLVAVAWADGKVKKPEENVLEALVVGFGADDTETKEVMAYAKTKRTLDNDVPYDELNDEDREILLGNAALMVQADGEEDAAETELLKKLSKLLGFDNEKAKEIIDSAGDGAIQLGTRGLIEED